VSYTKKLFDVDVSAALSELETVKGFGKTLRELHESSAHKEVSSICLRIPKPSGDDFYDYFNNLETVDSECSERYPKCNELVGIVARTLKSVEVGRALIAMLPANKSIDRHRDEGDYPNAFDRFHICLSGDCEWNGEKMKSGSVYWVDNSDYHEVKSGEKNRINIILDLRFEHDFK